MRTELSEKILRAFDAAPEITLAYPTQRITGVGFTAAKATPKRRKRKPPAAEESR